MSDNDNNSIPPGLSTMFIQSIDTLRQTQLAASIPPTWNDKPPLLEGPRGQPETPNLLKGVSNNNNNLQ